MFYFSTEQVQKIYIPFSMPFFKNIYSKDMRKIFEKRKEHIPK